MINSFKEHFCSLRQWILSLMTILFMADLANTFIKCSVYVHSLGSFYYLRTILYVLLSAATIKIKDEWLHADFATIATAGEIALI